MRFSKYIVVAVALLLLISSHVFSLTRYPVPSCDEAHYANVGYVFLETGRFGNDLPGKDAAQAINVPQVGRLLAIGLAILYSIFGVSLFVARLFSLIGFLVAVLGVYWAGSLAFNRATGRIGAVFFALAWITVMHSHNGRPDIWVAAGAIFSFATLLQTIRTAQVRWAALAGLVPVITIDFHLNGLHFLAASGFILTLWAIRRRSWQCWLTFVGTALVALGVWYAAHYLYYPYPGDYLGKYATQTSQISLIKKLLDLVDWWWRQYWVGTRYELLLQGIFFGVGVLWLLVRGESRGRLLLAYTGLSTLSFALLLQVQADYYRIIWMPFVALIVVEGLRALAGWVAARYPARLAGREYVYPAAVTALIVVYAASDAYLLYKHRTVDYDYVVDWMAERIPANSLVMADARWWYGLMGHYNFLEDFTFADAARDVPVEEVNNALNLFLAQRGPVYVLFDGHLGCLSDKDLATRELEPILQKSCRVVDTLDDPWFEHNVLYACNAP